MTHRLKTQTLRILTHPLVNAALRPVMQGRGAVFMLHRFAQPDLGIAGHDPAVLRAVLAWLRAQRFDLVPLADLFRRLQGDGPPPNRSVCFTIDDGYLDHALIGAPVFAEFDCPVTTFVTTGFLDGSLWFWWDRIEWIFHQSVMGRAQAQLGGECRQYQWSTPVERDAAKADFIGRCKEVPNDEKLEAIAALGRSAEVHLPDAPPTGYGPMSWEQLRACELRGMTFGPHTVTHPVLSRTSDAQSDHELEASWVRLGAEAANPVPVFCYPNGRLIDFGTRETATLRRLGMLGAVTGVEGYADARVFTRSAEAPFMVPRFSYVESVPHMVQFTSGLEWVKRWLRGGGAA